MAVDTRGRFFCTITEPSLNSGFSWWRYPNPSKTTNNKKPAYYAGFRLFRIYMVEAKGVEPLSEFI